MDDAVGATNLQGANETFKFMAKSSNKDNDLDGVFSSNLARLGGIKTLAGQVEKAQCGRIHSAVYNTHALGGM